MMASSVELLAPAGNRSSLHAAITSGADAVYLGLESFNARRGAENFTQDALTEALEYAHLRGVRVYVALNTLVLPDEVDEVQDLARQTVHAGVDAFIVQDVGLADWIARELPEVSLHISTQMNIHNKAGIQAAARLGASRVTLARELSLDEVAHLAREAQEYGIEIEVFVHGALCVCYSGQCLLSSMIGGRSANRGMCAQACRMPYTLYDVDEQRDCAAEGNYLLSPKDLCAIDLLGDLVRAGVASFKIEGRMKSPDYVAAVTRVYRGALDSSLYANEQTASCETEHSTAWITDIVSLNDASRDCHDELEAVFSRGLTTGYLVNGERGNDIMSYQRPNNRGQLVGRVQEVSGNTVSISVNREIALGDVIEFWTSRGHTAASVRNLKHKGEGVVSISLDEGAVMPRPGDRVFRVRSAEATFVERANEPRISIVGRVCLHKDEPLFMEFRVATPDEVLVNSAGDSTNDASDGSEVSTTDGDTGAATTGADADCTYAIARRLYERFGHAMPSASAEGARVEEARTRAVTEEEVFTHVARLGSTPFALAHLDIDLDAGVGIAFSELHQCRAQALSLLQDVILVGAGAKVAEKSRHIAEDACAGVTAKRASVTKSGVRTEEQRRSKAPNADLEVVALVANPRCGEAALRAGADAVYVSGLNFLLGFASYAGRAFIDSYATGWPQECRVILPRINHDSCGFAREVQEFLYDEVREYRKDYPGIPLVAESLGGLEELVRAGAPFEVGADLPITNALSLEMVAEMGAQRVWLSPELTLRQIGELAAETSVPLGITVSGRQELMVCEHCLYMSEGACDEDCTACSRRTHRHVLKDRMGYEFPVLSDALGRSSLYNSVPLDTVYALPELVQNGVSAFMVDATLLDVDETASLVKRANLARSMVMQGEGALDKLPDTTSGHLFRGVS